MSVRLPIHNTHENYTVKPQKIIALGLNYREHIQESDRIHGPAVELAKMGVKIEEKKDGMIIYGGEQEIKGGVMVESYGDHRMAMALSVAALKARYPVEIKDAECVNVSYPGFWNDLERLGVKIERKDDGGFD